MKFITAVAPLFGAIILAILVMVAIIAITPTNPCSRIDSEVIKTQAPPIKPNSSKTKDTDFNYKNAQPK